MHNTLKKNLKRIIMTAKARNAGAKSKSEDAESL